MPTVDYNLAAVQVNVGAFRVTGWSGDDGITVTWDADVFEKEVSADGTHIIYSRINDGSASAVLKVRRGTAAYRLLADKLVEHLAESDVGAITPLRLRIFAPISGDRIVERNIRFMNRPEMPFVKGASEAEFKLDLPNPTITYGGNIDTSA